MIDCAGRGAAVCRGDCDCHNATCRELPQTRVEPTKALQTAMTAAGIFVVPQPDLHTHFAVIDQEIVWYGSTNLLSRDKEDDGLMRIGSRDVALELLEEIGR